MLAAGLGVADYLTGHDLVISAFYLFPICWVTWSVGRRTGVILAVFSTITWLAADYWNGYGYFHPAIPLWNALMLLGMFLPSVYLLAAFQRAHVHLEGAVVERTISLQNEIEERKRAELAKLQAERLAMVGMMAAQVAHEVRNPLGAITLSLDLLEDDLGKIMEKTGASWAECTELLGALHEEVRRIDRVILDYLSLARPRSANLATLDLSGLISRKLSLMQGVFTKAQTSLETEFSKMPLLISADGDQLWQAILNLVRNSLEAMPDGGTLFVETVRDHDSAVLRIADTGCGMTPAQKEKLFVPFVTSKANGTGLGLALVNQIISEHDGRIECLSAPGNGTTFTIFLPLVRAAGWANSAQPSDGSNLQKTKI